MPNGSVACFQLVDFGTEEVEDLDLEVDFVLVDAESDLMDDAVEDEIEDRAGRMEGVLVELDPSSSVGLLYRLSVSVLWSSGTMVVVVTRNL